MRCIKEIRSKTGELHFKRWEILKTPWFSIWLHGIYKADTDLHLHNHPWDFTSIVLTGSYLEETENGDILQKPFKVNKRDGSNFHKIKVIYETTFTLFIVTKPKRTWGYNVGGEFIDNVTYRYLKNTKNLMRNV